MSALALIGTVEFPISDLSVTRDQPANAASIIFSTSTLDLEPCHRVLPESTPLAAGSPSGDVSVQDCESQNDIEPKRFCELSRSRRGGGSVLRRTGDRSGVRG